MNEKVNDTNPKGSLCLQSLFVQNDTDIQRITLGILNKTFQHQVCNAIKKAIEPYGIQYLKFSEKCDYSSISIPGDILYRYFLLQAEHATRNDSHKTFSNCIKSYCKDVLISENLKQIQESMQDSQLNHNHRYPDCVEDEEQGYLTVHVVLVPNSSLFRPSHLFRTNSKKMGRKRKRQHNNIESQGGNPRGTLEEKLNQPNSIVWTFNQAMDDMLSIPPDKLESGNWKQGFETILKENLPDTLLDIHVAVWRRPIYIRGMYTKSRRDVSQTPFYVVDKGEQRKLGITSVEEEISKILVKHLGGLSTLNNTDNPKTNVVYGMAKFHASGREDMDVRMLLPSIANPNSQITGRPFVYEIVDALRMPTPDDLMSIVQLVNHTQATIDRISVCDPLSTAKEADSKINIYGKNPAGVDISSDLKFVSSSAFKRLQAETEDKVKHYGCLCWCQRVLPRTIEEIQDVLGKCPKEILQWTPIRVLHRRSRLQRIRHVLSLDVTDRIDDHHFRLSLSTDAGTYVKEFVHSDLGRTHPSISSLLGCHTDILELDCEGIQI
jgi:tRNA U54 and U55 pseudouridine synthase Pus10